MKRIVVIGAGFGGVYAAKTLLKLFKKDSDVQITLINKTNYFMFMPMLHEVATGSLCGHSLSEPVREILRGKQFRFVKDVAMSINLKKGKVKTTGQTIPYDYLILATGSRANYFNIPGADRYTLSLKSLVDAQHIKKHVIESMEEGFKSTKLADKKRFASAVVIGAGATGIELAIELSEFMEQILESNKNNECSPEVHLIHAGHEILPQFPRLQKEARNALEKHNITLHLDTRVTEVKRDTVVLNTGVTISSHNVLWAAGVMPNTIPTTPAVTDNGRLVVNKYLQLPEFPHVYVIGDCASYTQPGATEQMPALAQVASEGGTHAGRNIYYAITKKPLRPFRYKLRGIMMSLGRGHGVGLTKGIKFRGFKAWFLMRTIYLFKIIGTSNRLKTAWEWTLELFVKRDTSQH